MHSNCVTTEMNMGKGALHCMVLCRVFHLISAYWQEPRAQLLQGNPLSQESQENTIIVTKTLQKISYMETVAIRQQNLSI